MAKFNFRQGIARRQENGLGDPTFLQKNGQYIDLLVSPDPTVYLIAHRNDTNYMFVENISVSQAWGPFTAGTTYWLYWDVSFLTGEITRGSTRLEPITSSSEPSSPATDQHWFDSNLTVMKRWDGACWQECIRVFAVKYLSAATLVHYPLGTQVGIGGINQEHFAGVPLFDPDDKPLQVWRRDRRGRFITTETAMHAQFARNANFRVEAAINQAEAIESIPINYAIAYTGINGNEVMLARNTLPSNPSIGISVEAMVPGEVRSFITKGFISNPAWAWTEDPGTKLFVGASGQLTSTLPVIDSIQEMGIVVDDKTIFVNPQSLKILNRGDVQSGNYVPMYTDRATGEEVMWDRAAFTAPGTYQLMGYVHNQVTPANIWTITHPGGTSLVTVQVRDLNNEVLVPNKIDATDNDTVVIEFDGIGSPGIPVSGTALLTLFIS